DTDDVVLEKIGEGQMKEAREWGDDRLDYEAKLIKAKQSVKPFELLRAFNCERGTLLEVWNTALANNYGILEADLFKCQEYRFLKKNAEHWKKLREFLIKHNLFKENPRKLFEGRPAPATECKAFDDFQTHMLQDCETVLKGNPLIPRIHHEVP